MNWDAVGATGEWAGAIAVVVSLVYLAIQIRQNSRHLAETAKRATQSAIYEQNLVTFQDGDAQRILRKGMQDNHALTPEEWNRFHNFWMTAFMTYQEAFKEVKKAGTDDDFWNILEQHIRTYLNTPGLSFWWKKNKTMFNSEFVDYFAEESSTRDA